MKNKFGRFTAISIAAAAAWASASAVQAQNFPITPGQKATATQVAQAGVPTAVA